MQQTINADIVKQQTQNILKRNNQQITAIDCHTFMNNDTKYFILIVQQISSTMLLSSNFSRDLFGQKQVIVFVAKKQYLGRGQKNNQWVSPQGNLYMTILTKIKIQVFSIACLITAISITQVVSEIYGIQLGIKWVNDLFLDNKKVGGFLIKSDIIGTNNFVQIGIGLNINKAPLQNSISINQFSNNKLQIEQVCKRIAFLIGNKIMSKNIHSIKQQVIALYQKQLIYIGKWVDIYDYKLQNIVYTGIFTGINQYGFAVIQEETKNSKIVSDGRMRLREF